MSHLAYISPSLEKNRRGTFHVPPYLQYTTIGGVPEKANRTLIGRATRAWRRIDYSSFLLAGGPGRSSSCSAAPPQGPARGQDQDQRDQHGMD